MTGKNVDKATFKNATRATADGQDKHIIDDVTIVNYMAGSTVIGWSLSAPSSKAVLYFLAP